MEKFWIRIFEFSSEYVDCDVSEQKVYLPTMPQDNLDDILQGIEGNAQWGAPTLWSKSVVLDRQLLLLGTHTHTHTHTDRQTGRQTDRQKDRDRQRESETERVCKPAN